MALEGGAPGAEASTEPASNEGAESTATESTEGAAAEGPAKFKAKWRGADHEDTAENLRRMLSDEYEHEFSGPEGRTVKQTWPQITRSVQLSEGAQQKMREAAEERKRYSSMLEWGKANVPEFLSSQLGMDIEDLVMEHGRRMFERSQEYAKLSPIERERRIAQDAERKAEAKYAWERQQRELAEQARSAKEAESRAEAAVSQALQQRGLKPSAKNLALARELYQEYSSVGFKLTLENLADMTVEKYRKGLLDELDGHEGESLLQLLGSERREKLRQLEIAAADTEKRKAKEKAKEQRATAPRPANGAGEKKGLSDAEFRKHYRIGGGGGL